MFQIKSDILSVKGDFPAPPETWVKFEKVNNHIFHSQRYTV